MADRSLVDGKFWLSHRFLADNDVFMGEKTARGGLSPFEFSSGSGNRFGSLVESPVALRQSARSTIEDGSVLDASAVLVGSPQSPPCAVEGGRGSNQGSSGGSPNTHSLVFLIPTSLDRLQHLRQPPLLKQRSSPLSGNQNKTTGKHQSHVSGMRAVFLVNHGGKRECAGAGTGTGVFLPRRTGNSRSVTQTKPASSTVFIPAKVIQALNLNFDEMHVQPQIHPRFVPDCDAALRFQSDCVRSHQKRNLHVQPVELRLPNEWTY